MSYDPPVFDPVAAWGIGGLAVVVAAAWTLTWTPPGSRQRVRLILVTALVMAASGWAAQSGLLAREGILPPPMALMIAAVFGMAAAVGASRFGATVAGSVPLATLVGLQAFRLPLELLMHRAGELGIMPRELSYGGYNFDIVTGAGALLLWAAMRARLPVPAWVVWVWNVWGIGCLVMIAVIAITTSPLLRLFGDDPRHVNSWVLHMPYVWLPVVLVTIAIAGHVVITRALVRSRTRRAV